MSRAVTRAEEKKLKMLMREINGFTIVTLSRFFLYALSFSFALFYIYIFFFANACLFQVIHSHI